MRASHTNLRSFEGSVNGEKTIEFDLRPRTLMITNDSVSQDLKFKFHESENLITLKPSETITIPNVGNDLILQGSNVTYRIWGFS